jgi:hypothetical protein
MNCFSVFDAGKNLKALSVTASPAEDGTSGYGKKAGLLYTTHAREVFAFDKQVQPSAALFLQPESKLREAAGVDSQSPIRVKRDAVPDVGLSLGSESYRYAPWDAKSLPRHQA